MPQENVKDQEVVLEPEDLDEDIYENEDLELDEEEDFDEED